MATAAARLEWIRPGAWAYARRLWNRRQTVLYLAGSQLKAGHRDKVLGHLWSLLDPLLFIGIYFFVFGVLFRERARGGTTHFLLYLSLGVLAWRFFDAAVSQCAACIRGHRALIHEINFPKAVFPFAIALARLYDFLWALLAVIVVALLAGRALPWTAVLVPLVVLLHVLLILGAGLIVAYLGAFFADTTNIVAVAMRLWMYASPVFYYATGPYGRIPDRYASVYMLNPIATLLSCYRATLLGLEPLQPDRLAYLALVSVALFAAGFALFARGEGDFAKYV